MCNRKEKYRACFLGAILFLLTFQNALELLWQPFSYLDEGFALIGAIWAVYEIAAVQRCRPTKTQLLVGIPLLLFSLIGLTGNLLYRYQPMKSAIVDLYTNLKFFFAIGTGYFLFRGADWEILKKTVVFWVRLFTLVLFAVFVADRIFVIWPSQIRYGISSAVLFYQYPTYMAGSVAFLLALLTIVYEKKNLPCIAMALVMMFFTLRSKAFGSVAVYAALFVVFAVLGRKMKWQYVASCGVICLAIASPMIYFYFVKNADSAARSVMLVTSLLIMKDYFPIGTGFGTYASAEAIKHYSPVYVKYGFNNIWQLRNPEDLENTMRLISGSPSLTKLYQQNPELVNDHVFFSDTFWPILFAQTGVLGTVLYVFALGVIGKRCLEVERYDRYAFTGVLFVIAYLIIASVGEPAFHNSVSIPLAMVLGLVFVQMPCMSSGKAAEEN